MFDLNILEDLVENGRKSLSVDVDQLMENLEKLKCALHEILIEYIKLNPFNNEWCVSIHIEDKLNLRKRDIVKTINEKLFEYSMENEKYRIKYHINNYASSGFNYVCIARVL